MNILDRLTSPTPGFFIKVRNWGLALAAIGAAVIGAPVMLPVLVVKIAGYIIVAGSVMTALGQAAVPGEPAKDQKDNHEESTQ